MPCKNFQIITVFMVLSFLWLLVIPPGGVDHNSHNHPHHWPFEWFPTFFRSFYGNPISYWVVDPCARAQKRLVISFHTFSASCLTAFPEECSSFHSHQPGSLPTLLSWSQFRPLDSCYLPAGQDREPEMVLYAMPVW